MNNANEWRLWVLKGSVAASFLRLKGILDSGLQFPVCEPIIDTYDYANQPCVALWRVDA